MKPITCECGKVHYLTETELNGAITCQCGQPLTKAFWSAVEAEAVKTQRRYALPEPAVPVSFLQPLWDALASVKQLVRPKPALRFAMITNPPPTGTYVVQTFDGKFLQEGHPTTVVRDVEDATHLPEAEAHKLAKRFFGSKYRQNLIVEHHPDA